MSDIIKYAIECETLYGVVAIFIVCILLGFIAILLYRVLLALFMLVKYITNKITKYNDVHTKAQCKNTHLEVDLHMQDENRG